MARNRSTEMSRRVVLLRCMLQRARKRRQKIQCLLTALKLQRNRLIKATVLLLLLFLAKYGVTITHPHSCRRLRRNTGWWKLVKSTYSEARFRKNFRVSRETFNFILSRIKPELERKKFAEEPVSPELRLAVCLCRLARGSYYHTISEMCGLGLSTVCTITKEVSQAIIDILWEDNVTKYMPDTEQEFEHSMVEMEAMWQFPYCWAALDGCHIPIKCPPGGLESGKEYHNFKNFYSVVLMALIDSHYRFVWASCGYPGNSHDAIIFKSTDLYSRITNGSYVPLMAQSVGEQQVRPLIVADSAFPLTTWLMKPFTHAVLTETQRYFNYRLSRARMVTEGAYGQLKGRWRVLLRKCESNTESVVRSTLACIVLHNVCITRGDTIFNKLDLSIDPNTSKRRDSNVIRELLQMRKCSTIRENGKHAEKIRDEIGEKLMKEKETGLVC